MTTFNTLERVKEYYGQFLKTNQDLVTTACCVGERLPEDIRTINEMIHPEVKEKFYGCGLTIPQQLTGLSVLDLGSGSGRDCYLLSKLVGPSGHVTGVDMTPEQLEVARRHQDYHAEIFGHPNSNVSFVEGYIEDLEAAGIPSESMDLVVSNCVFNLSPNKPRVFSEVFRVLKPGGELYFSDVFTDRRLPDALKTDPVLVGECLGGAMYIEDFRRTLLQLGVRDFRVVSKNPVTITNPELRNKVGLANFVSITVRAFKLDIEDRCEDYGQVAYYRGTIAEAPHAFRLDDHHLFEKNKPLTVCSNTASMLQDTRFKDHFRIEGDTSVHFGLFDCGPSPIQATTGGTAPGGACC